MFSSMKAMIVAWFSVAVMLAGTVIWANGEYAAVQAQREAMRPPVIAEETTADEKVVSNTIEVTDTVLDATIKDEGASGGLPDEATNTEDTTAALTAANDISMSDAANQTALLEATLNSMSEAPTVSLANWKLYSAEVALDPNLKPIAILMTDMGLNARRTEDAINQLPNEISFAFSPYSHEMTHWSPIVLNHGNEFLMMLPMEPIRYPVYDPGPLGLLVEASTEQNITRLDAILDNVTGYIGVVNHMGSRMTADEASLMPVFQHLKSRGLMFVDSRTTAKSIIPSVADKTGLPYAVNSRYIDNEQSEAAIMKQLKALEARAAKRGSAMGIARLSTVSVATIKTWADTLQSKGFQLVPVSAIVHE